MFIPWTYPAPSCLGGPLHMPGLPYRAFPCLAVGKPLLFLPHSAYISSPQRGLPWSDCWRRALVLVLVMAPASFTALVTMGTYYLLAGLSNASFPPQAVCLLRLSQGLAWKLKLNERTGGLGRRVFLWDWRKGNKEWSPRAILRWRVSCFNNLDFLETSLLLPGATTLDRMTLSSRKKKGERENTIKRGLRAILL